MTTTDPVIERLREKFPYLITETTGVEETLSSLESFLLAEVNRAREEERKFICEIIKALQVEKPDREDEQNVYLFKKTIVHEIRAKLLETLESAKHTGE